MNHLQCNTDFYQSAKLIASNWFSGYSKFFPCDAHFIVPYVRLFARLREKIHSSSECVEMVKFALGKRAEAILEGRTAGASNSFRAPRVERGASPLNSDNGGRYE